ncbi:hypothetical protein RHMOL_Rhmol05G0203300 [Rhododendron molle]|uniref:Uncharacterized protein n=1 Tax=Rhododendron molle TaxID=49168 RepID=A0ACC0NQZ1_RHOML|nr:hypothetical protein RHMOL_Rhmol05G0203300 [Rhododendron molle]
MRLISRERRDFSKGGCPLCKTMTRSSKQMISAQSTPLYVCVCIHPVDIKEDVRRFLAWTTLPDFSNYFTLESYVWTKDYINMLLLLLLLLSVIQHDPGLPNNFSSTMRGCDDRYTSLEFISVEKTRPISWLGKSEGLWESRIGPLSMGQLFLQP